MGFRVLYKSLFDVTIRHGFHLNHGSLEFDELTQEQQQSKLAGFDLFTDVGLHVPSETEKTLAGLGCLLRTTRTGFKVATEVEQSGNEFLPVRVPDRAFRIRVVLETREPRFWNYTNVKFDSLGRVVYYLSNRAGQSGAAFPELSLPEPPYAAGTSYAAGDVVQAVAGLFLAVRSGAHPVPAADDANWLKLAASNYVSESDHVTLRSPVFSFQPPVEMVTIDAIQITGQDGTPVDLEVPVASPGKAFPIDASGFAAGQYTLVVRGRDGSSNPVDEFSEKIYLDAQLPKKNVVAIFELFHLPGEVLGPFRLYDEANSFKLLQPEFMVRLLNRHTYWRYRFRVKPTGALGDLEQVDDQFVTKKAMPLTRAVQKVELGGGWQLPNAAVDQIVPGVDRIYSEVHVHVTP